MYWLLDYTKQEDLRQQIINLQTTIIQEHRREQSEQVFPFIGRKSRNIATSIINTLAIEGDVVCDPFGGSGTFAYAALDSGKKVFFNEWEPFAFRLSTSPFRGVPSDIEYSQALSYFINIVEPIMANIYKTRCPICGKEFMFDSIFFDRSPEEFYHPMRHERMGLDAENVIFRSSQYKCDCGCKEKHYDHFDEQVRLYVARIDCEFPNVELIENSRLNFTAPTYTKYENLFSKRQKIALITMRNAISQLSDSARSFFEDTFLSIIHLGKYTDYRSKSQDNHCPANRLKETNLYHRFLEKLEERKAYIELQNFDCSNITVSSRDFREFFSGLSSSSVDLVLTDPPYGDNAQYFEHAQRVHPFMNYSLMNDEERLMKEVVISNAPIRENKHSKEQFLADIEKLIIDAHRVIRPHGFLVLYFRPEQRDWISDLNKLKHFGRKHGFEPIISIPIDNRDPSMRVLASAAWTFRNDVCFIFLRLNENERRWYDGDTDVDELIYLAASSAATDQGNPFVIERFNNELQAQFRRCNLIRLLRPTYVQRIQKTLERFTVKNQAQYHLTGLSPYNFMNRDMNAEVRLREFAPVVIEELTADGSGFTFEEYVIHLASFMENGSREIIEKLHTANRLIPELLNIYAEEDPVRGKFYARNTVAATEPREDKICIRTMDPSDFEQLIADYFIKRGFIRANVIGRSCDRGVDVLATNINGELELIQCKRYREGNNIGSTPIQRVDSYMRSRHAVKAWVVTTSDFTPEGKDEARITNVTIINGQELIQSLELYYPGKYTL